MRWLIHALGIDTQQSWAYDFWSGVATQLPLPNWIIAAVWYRRHNCHEARCHRLGRHMYGGAQWCARHRPSAPADGVS